MNRRLYVVGMVMLVAGLTLLAVAAVHAMGWYALFADPPWLAGGGLATIGGLIAGGSRPKP